MWASYLLCQNTELWLLWNVHRPFKPLHEFPYCLDLLGPVKVTVIALVMSPEWRESKHWQTFLSGGEVMCTKRVQKHRNLAFFSFSRIAVHNSRSGYHSISVKAALVNIFIVLTFTSNVEISMEREHKCWNYLIKASKEKKNNFYEGHMYI